MATMFFSRMAGIESPKNQESLHCTPEHCLVNGGVPLFRCGKSHGSNGCNMYLLRIPDRHIYIYIDIHIYIYIWQRCFSHGWIGFHPPKTRPQRPRSPGPPSACRAWVPRLSQAMATTSGPSFSSIRFRCLRAAPRRLSQNVGWGSFPPVFPGFHLVKTQMKIYPVVIASFLG